MTEEAVYRMEGTKVSATRSSTAIVKRFQTEKKILSSSEWQAPLSVRISQPYVVVKTYWEKSDDDDIFIRFDTMPACDGHERQQ